MNLSVWDGMEVFLHDLLGSLMFLRVLMFSVHCCFTTGGLFFDSRPDSGSICTRLGSSESFRNVLRVI